MNGPGAGLNRSWILEKFGEKTMSQIRFDNQVAVITGAGAGIGREYARDLAKRGAAVVINDVNDTAEATAEQICRAGGRAVACQASVATMKGGQQIIDTALDRFGRLDILINNAGILRDRTFVKMSEAEWDQVINVHLKGTFCVTQPAVKVMKKNGYGRIIFTASSSGLYGNFGQSNYGAAKMGVIGIMNTLKLEVKKYGILINTVAPNADTGMTQGVFPEAVARRIRPAFNTPLVTYLCARENTVSGMIFTMSAGWFARTAIVSGSGTCIGDTKREIQAEEIRDEFDRITSIQDAQPYDLCGAIYQLGAPFSGR